MLPPDDSKVAKSSAEWKWEWSVRTSDHASHPRPVKISWSGVAVSPRYLIVCLIP